ncbi:MAG: FGGY family carbohydrate kinase [Caldilineaceae bacterium]
MGPLGNAVAEGRASTHYCSRTTWYEQNVEEWWSSTAHAIRQCVGQVDVRRVAALGITHQRETFALLGAAGQSVRNGILWLDERSRTQVQWLEQTFGRDALHQITGKPPAMTPSLPKIVWLLQNEPEAVAKAHKIVDVHAFLSHRLTGHFRTSLASADPMGLVDMPNQCWAVDIIEALGLRQEQFAELLPPGASSARFRQRQRRSPDCRSDCWWWRAAVMGNAPGWALTPPVMAAPILTWVQPWSAAP